MNLFALARKLQRALILQGRPIKINQTQVWIEDTKRMATKYTVKEQKNVKGKIKDEVLMDSYNLAEVVRFLADLLSGGES